MKSPERKASDKRLANLCKLLLLAKKRGDQRRYGISVQKIAEF